MNPLIGNVLDTGIRWLRWLLRPNPRRFLAVWYTVWLGFSLKAFVVNWLIRHQPIRIAWVPVTGSVETVYLLAEIGVVGAIVWQAWRFGDADWRLAIEILSNVVDGAAFLGVIGLHPNGLRGL